MKSYLLAFVLLLSVMVAYAHGTISVTNLNTTMILNTNGTARVNEVLTLGLTNESVSQYTADRLALNFTLGQWQNLIGPILTEHIVNPKGATYDLSFLPGAINNSQNGKVAYLYLSYLVTNVTAYNETGPRVFLYSFNNRVFNFQHAESGQVLGDNTSLTIILPQSSQVVSIYPIPDAPVPGPDQNYGTDTRFSWSADEPLSRFVLTFDVQQSLEGEVLQFFGSIYDTYGAMLIVLAIGVAAFFIVYVYVRTK